MVGRKKRPKKHRNPPPSSDAAEALRVQAISLSDSRQRSGSMVSAQMRRGVVQCRGHTRPRKRPSDNPLIVHVDSIEMVNRLLNPNGSLNTKIPAIYEPISSISSLARARSNPPAQPKGFAAGERSHGESTPRLACECLPRLAFARLLIHVADGRPSPRSSANASSKKPSPSNSTTRLSRSTEVGSISS